MIQNYISNINWLSVVVLTVFSFVIGFAWHQSFLFGKIWKKENYGDKEIKVNPALIFGGTGIMHFLALAILSAVVSGKGSVFGLEFGLLISAGWIFPALAGTYLFASRSLKLLAIDAGMYILLFAVSGLIMGAW